MNLDWDFSTMMDLFSREEYRSVLHKGMWGLEKEAIRVTPEGRLSLAPHPRIFGNKLENQYITTDFSESQIEIITPAFDSIEETHTFLRMLQRYVEQSIGEELLWPLSMPVSLPDEDQIPLARYDGSAAGNIKEIYRSGLAQRYGKQMQMISGIHYNFSFKQEMWDNLQQHFDGGLDSRQFQDVAYFSLARNFIKYRWLLIYLYGASPVGTDAYVNTFFKQNVNACPVFVEEYRKVNYSDECISMRMSRFGYENAYQNDLTVSCNSLEEYVRDLKKVLATKVDAYTKIGLFRDGKQIQLNDNLLQSENEYYSPVRFKQITATNETLLDALLRRGIRYVEFRTFDLDPFEKTGIGLDELYFIHVYVLFCLLNDNRSLTEESVSRFSSNAHKVALHGRKAGLMLMKDSGREIGLSEWGTQIFEKLKKIAGLLDHGARNPKYLNSIETQLKKLTDPSLLPSSKIVRKMKTANEDHDAFGLRIATSQKERNGAIKVQSPC